MRIRNKKTRSRLAPPRILHKVPPMLGKFLAACGVYLVLGAVIGWCILFVMRPEGAKIWQLCLVMVGYLVAFTKIGCTEH